MKYEARRRRHIRERNAPGQTHQDRLPAQLDIAPRDFRDGFPGLDINEWFGLDIRFTVNMPQDPEMNTVKLVKGLRHFRVRYFQGLGYGLAPARRSRGKVQQALNGGKSRVGRESCDFTPKAT